MDIDMSMRYAHCEGHTDVCYEDSGKYFITSGTDGDIRIYDGFEDDDPKTHHMGETVTALTFKNGKLYLSTDANAVIPYTFPDVNSEGLLLQFIVSIYHIACSEDGRYIAAGGGDFTIKVYDIFEKKFTPFKGHEAPILSLALDPNGSYLASSSCDGTVKIWQLTEANCIKSWSLFKKSNDLCNSPTLCRLQWTPKTGKFIAIPVDKEIKFYERDSWNCNFSLTDDSIDQVLSLCSFSACGSFIAAATTNGLIVVWEMKTKKVIAKRPHEKNMAVCSIAWNPAGKKEFVFCDVEGQLGFFNDFKDDNNKNKLQPLADLHSKNDENEDNFELDDDDVDSKMSGDIPENDDDDDENAFDLGAIRAEYEPKIFGTQKEGVNEVSVKDAPVAPQIKVIEAPTTPLQTSFQPGSTPAHLDQRFMVWNSIGIVRCYNTEEETSIDVEFHDASIYHPINMNNSRGFTMAALSSEALLLASPKCDELPSHLQCLHISTWDSNKEWSIDMPTDEEIEAIALGSGWVAVATDLRLIRIFTISGVQCEIFCSPGPIVCLATADNQLAIVFHGGAGIPGEQNLHLQLVKVKLNSQCVCRNYPLPLSSKAYLAWLGFTDEGQLCTVDTSGIVRMLIISCASKWLPIANLKSHAKGKSDNYFVVGLSEIQQEIRCIPCKGARYPALLPRPTVTVLPFNFPFCETSSDKGRLEEEQSRLAVLHNRIKTLIDNEFDLDSELSNVERKWTDILLKMFALATRSDREYRALDITELMPNHKIVQGAIKYATLKHHMALAERLGEVVHKKIMEEASSTTTNTNESFEEEMLDVSANFKILNSKANQEEEDVLQPKPLSRLSTRYSKENSLTADNYLDDEPTSFQQQQEDEKISLLLKNSPTVNPFRKLDKNISSNNSRLSNTGIDDLLDETTKRLSSKGSTVLSAPAKKTSKQSKLFAQKEISTDKTPVEPKKFGFNLFLDENKEKIKTDNPDAEDFEIVKIATKLFKELPHEEKEKYKVKPKVAPKSDKKSKDEETSNKRKLKDDNNEETSKKSKKDNTKLAPETKNKLSMFSFIKPAASDT